MFLPPLSRQFFPRTMSSARARRIRNVICSAVFVLGCGATAHAQQTISLLERIQTEGTVKTVGASVITVTDSAGKDTEFKIQPKDEQGVPLSGTPAVIDFPAHVEIRGVLKSESLTPGTLVRFTGKVNRLGRTDGDVDQIVVFDEKRYKLGLQVVKEAKERSGYAECTIAGDVFSCRDNRLVVTVPKTEYARNNRLAFSLSKDVKVSLESDNYRRAKRGDKVTRLLAARFSTGDVVIKELTIEATGDAAQQPRAGSVDLSKYRHLSDAPSKPRDVRSPHFLLHTDVSDRNAQVLLDTLETMIVLVSNYFGRPPAGILECYVVRDLQQWPPGLIPPEGVAKISEPAGVTLSVRVGNLAKSLVYSCDKVGVVQHESVHAYCQQTFGDTGPTWYAEGVAEMGHYWKKDLLAVEIDPVVINYLKSSPPKKMLDIVAAGQITGDSWQAYAWRWALCHLLVSNPNYAGRFKALGVALMSQQPGYSFESVYGPLAREISFEYDFFVRHLDNGFRSDLCAWQWGRKFQYLPAQGHVTVKVAAKYGWQASGVKLAAGQAFDYAAKDTWKLQSGGDGLTADGDANGQGRLAGIIMKDFSLGEPFDLGTRGTCQAPQEGELYLRCRDGWNQIGDNDGTISVHLRKSSVP
jgi:hypothetical protein